MACFKHGTLPLSVLLLFQFWVIEKCNNIRHCVIHCFSAFVLWSRSVKWVFNIFVTLSEKQSTQLLFFAASANSTITKRVVGVLDLTTLFLDVLLVPSWDVCTHLKIAVACYVHISSSYSIQKIKRFQQNTPLSSCSKTFLTQAFVNGVLTRKSIL